MADIGTGATITWETGFFAEILDLSWSGISREAIQTSHFGTTGGHTFIPTDIYDPGELEVEFALDPNTDPFTVIQEAAENVTLTFPIPAGGSAGATWVVSAFCVNVDVDIPFEDRMVGRATLKLSGSVTPTDSS